jgi:predicted RNA binding protein YcfA (HicA-like mRNA interferase family)
LIDRLKSVAARDWIVALERDGFLLRKGRGSHHINEHSDGRRALVVYHKLSDNIRAKDYPPTVTSAGWQEADVRRVGLIR